MHLPFSYDLPQDRIAQRPAVPYDSAKLLLLDRSAETMRESVFAEFQEALRPEDVLVFNNTRVLPARLFGKFAGEGGGEVELLLLEPRGEHRWLCLGRPLKRFKKGRELQFANGLSAHVLDREGAQHVLVEFFSKDSASAAGALLRQSGVMPIPPYIRKGMADQRDRDDYQTFFAEHEGSVAAPTASLHFTPELLTRIRARGCGVAFVTLHLGTASFLPLWSNSMELSDAPVPPGLERGFFQSEVLPKLIAAKQRGGRVVAVGTSVARLLESAARMQSLPQGVVELATDLFIQPGFEFKLVDALVTNFHQPRTTHLLLVEAFIGRSLLSRSYEYAMQNNFRFLSYGDGMFIS